MDTNSIVLWLVLLLSIVLIAALVRRRATLRSRSNTQAGLKLSGSPVPDWPIPFGYKCAWYSIQSPDVGRLVQLIGLQEAQSATWREGIESAYGDLVFVSPAVGGWAFVVGASLAAMEPRSLTSQVRPVLEKLSSEFEIACFFATHRVVELHIWAKATKGKLERAYGYLGETGEIIWDEGMATVEEVGILSHIDEAAVMQIARGWSLAPIDLEGISSEPSLGFLGTL
ncbi:MAG: hypothetical protein A2Z37_15050 [Chloroflexi bacterium RBG_19FT_COMBO_62_14]|nr:MAG: hypothetical protein A2Z37_15050 [Chloroflexi bacterium RBG_19FT_COMBO_62_14]